MKHKKEESIVIKGKRKRIVKKAYKVFKWRPDQLPVQSVTQ